MSQKKEKYARRMERRVGKLEECMGRMAADMTSQKIRVSIIEDDLAVYRAAVTRREEKRIRLENEQRRKARKAEAERKERRTRRIVYLSLVLAAVALAAFIMTTAAKAEDQADKPAAPAATVEPFTVNATLNLYDALDVGQVPPVVEEMTEEALLAQGYYSIAVPLPYEYQGYMREYSAAYGCPYPLALATAEVESDFNMDALGAVGEVGIMQLNPGPGGSYHTELEDATGLDPATPVGNIAGGCYLLGKYMEKYEDPAKAAMAYNMGEARARELWAEGITSSAYSDKILEAVERWECTVNAWNGQ